MSLWIVGLLLLVQGKHLLTGTNDSVANLPWSKINTTQFSNITEPAFPNIALYAGSLSLGQTTIRFIMEACLKSTDADVLRYPFLFWVDDVGRSSVVSWLFESGLVRIGKKDGRYTATNNSEPMSKQFNVVYLDMAGVGLSDGNGSRSLDESVKQLQTIVGKFKEQLNETGLKYYVGARGYNSIVMAQLAQNTQKDQQKKEDDMAEDFEEQQPEIVHSSTDSSGPLGVILINSKPHPQAILTSISDHTYNMGLINYQEKTKADQMTLLLTYQLAKQSSNIYMKYLQFLGNLSKWGGLQHHDYYLNSSDVDASVIESFMNEPEVKTAFGITQFKQYSEDVANQYTDLFRNTVPILKGLIQKDIKTVLLQGQTDIEDNPLSVMKWLDDVNPNWSAQQLKPLQDQSIIGFERKQANSWFWFVHRNGKYIRSPGVISRIRSWLI